MRNYFGGLHQFPTNINNQYRFVVIGDVVLSGTGQCLTQLDYILGSASLRDITDAFYLGSALSVAEAESWPRIPNITTWCLYPPPNNGNGREDVRAAPPGFVIARPGYMMPVFLHHRPYRPTGAAVHLVAGLPHTGDRELPDGGYEISIGTFPFAAATVELQLNDNGELECQVVNWQLDNLHPEDWP